MEGHVAHLKSKTSRKFEQKISGRTAFSLGNIYAKLPIVSVENLYSIPLYVSQLSTQ